eukprot:SAG31_NODE_40572_length_280_cov_0.574586_1_plen_31_part_01
MSAASADDEARPDPSAPNTSGSMDPGGNYDD